LKGQKGGEREGSTRSEVVAGCPAMTHAGKKKAGGKVKPWGLLLGTGGDSIVSPLGRVCHGGGCKAGKKGPGGGAGGDKKQTEKEKVW